MKKEARQRRLRALIGTAVALASYASPLVPALQAQFGPPKTPPTVIKGGTLHVGNGDVIANATVVMRGKEIEAVGGADLAVPEGATVVDATGKHLYPGLIDVESTLLLDDESRSLGDGNPAARVADAIDWFDAHDFTDAWSGGVTTVGIASRRGLLDGARAVVKVKRARRDDAFLAKEGDLTATFGIGGSRPSMRLREWKSFAEQLDATKKYIESWDEYGEKIEEYKKALEKWGKEGDKLPAGGKKEESAPKTEGAPPSGPPPGGGREGRRGGRPNRHHHDHDTPFMRWMKDTMGWICDCEEAQPTGYPTIDHKAGKVVLADGVSYAENPPKPAGEGGKEGEKPAEAPTKPPRPAREPQREALRRLLDEKAGLSVYADAAADLQNLLDLLRAFPMKVTITGGGDVAELADELAAASIGVVVVQPHDLGSKSLDAAAKLDAAGVPVVLTTAGRTGGATRFLSLSAAAAIAGGLDKEHALAAITSRAAELLGVADRVGTVAAGKDADLLIASGDLFASTTVVEQLFIDGASVLKR